MNKEDLKIVFFGTGKFAKNALEELLKNNYNIVGVVTMGDNIEIVNMTNTNNIPLLRPTKLLDENFIQSLRELNADLQVVVSFKILPEVIWSIPKYGTFNCHFALLPNYKGACPIEWALINGEKETGVTTFFIDNGIDTGKIILQSKIEIKNDDNFYTLGEKLSNIANPLICNTIDLIINNNEIIPTFIVNNNNELKIAPKITDAMCQIDFNKTYEEIQNWYKGMIGHNIWCNLKMNDGTIQRIKVKSMSIIPSYVSTDNICGKQYTDNKHYLHIFIKNGIISLIKVQIPSKKELGIEDFLNGYRHKILFE